MGGQAYLTRVAFGRSAYEPIRGTQRDEPPTVCHHERSEEDGYAQQYDRKGNPVNVDATRRTDAQIAASNEVLAAVGVCEKKNDEARQGSGRVTFSEEEWKTIQEQENSIGESGRIVAECVRHASSWWLIALRKRIQAGIIDSNQPFSSILSHEWRTITSSGFRGALRYLTAGAIPELAGQVLAILLEYMLEEVHIKLCEIPYRLRLRRPQRQRLLRYIDNLNIGLLISAQILLSPLAISATLQQLGLATSLPASTLFPWNPLSPLRWAWFRRADPLPLGSQILSILLSPASLWSVSNILYQSLALNYGTTPFCPERLILGPTDQIRRPDATNDSSWPMKSAPDFLKPLLRFRNAVLVQLGWAESPKSTRTTALTEDNSSTTFLAPLGLLERLESSNRRRHDMEVGSNMGNDGSNTSHHSNDAHSSGSVSENNNDDDGADLERVAARSRIHRSTELAKFPAYFLGLNIDGLIGQVLFLPLESLYLRTLVSCFWAGPIGSSGYGGYGRDSGRGFAIGQGPLSVLVGRRGGFGLSSAGLGRFVGVTGWDVSRAEWATAGNYVSKVGLCMGLQFSLDSIMWGCAYAWTRWTGIGRFSWGVV